MLRDAEMQALKQVPGVNASWHGEFIRQYHNIDISIAVQTPNGLMVPVVKDSHSKGLTEIGSAVKALANKVSKLTKIAILLLCQVLVGFACDMLTSCMWWVHCMLLTC